MLTLLIEDDEVIARELSLHWHSRGWAMRHAGTIEAGSRLLTLSGAFDLVLLDLGLPDGDGIEALRALRASDMATPVIILTARDQLSDRVLGLRQGADDYLVKPFAIEELDARVENILRRHGAEQRQRASLGELIWLGNEGRALLGQRPLELSPREFEVLGLLMRRAPHVLPKRMLVDALAERNLDVDDSVAEVYVSRLRRKLAGSGIGIRTFRGFGYLIEACQAEEDPA